MKKFKLYLLPLVFIAELVFLIGIIVHLCIRVNRVEQAQNEHPPKSIKDVSKEQTKLLGTKPLIGFKQSEESASEPEKS